MEPKRKYCLIADDDTVASEYCAWVPTISTAIFINKPYQSYRHIKTAYGWYGMSPCAYNGPNNSDESLRFKYIFTNRTAVLTNCVNARLAPPMDAPWYGDYFYGGYHYAFSGKIDDHLYEKKTKCVSVLLQDGITSNRDKLRSDIFFGLRACAKNADFYESAIAKTFLGAKVYEPYMFNVCVENRRNEYYFSEKITTCFLSQTVPIYVGASKIGEWYNTDGIIQVAPENIGQLPSIVNGCCKEWYTELLPAVRDNYNRVRSYPLGWDYAYRTYLMDLT